MKQILTITIAVLGLTASMWAYNSIDASSGVVFHESVSLWPSSSNDGTTTWQMDDMKYHDTDGDGNVDSRTTVTSDGISNIFIIALDSDKDGFFDELLTQRLTGGGAPAQSSKIRRAVPSTE